MKTNGRVWQAGVSKAWMTGALALAFTFGAVGAFAQDQNYQNADPDPAAANMAPGDAAQVQAAGGDYYQQQPADYPQQAPAPVIRNGAAAYPQGSYQDQQGPLQGSYAGNPNDPNGSYDPSQQQLGPDQYDTDVDAGQAALDETDPAMDTDQPPPALPDYDQPPAPEPDYMWTPGYWGWADTGYYWVPGAWVGAPYPGALWTPGYWFFYGDRYRWHRGYWGLHIGYYGGINYGFGYIGTGYYGGYWNGGHFFYNTSITRVNVRFIRNVYVHPAPRPIYGGYARISFNGGPRGVPARPRPAEIVAMREHHTPSMSTQIQFRQQAAQNRSQFFNQNHGRPQTVVAARPVQADRNVAPPQRGFVNNRPGQNANRPGNNGGNFNRGGNGNNSNGNDRNNGGFRENNSNSDAMRNAQEQQRLQQQNMDNMRLQNQQGNQQQQNQQNQQRPNNQQQPNQGQPQRSFPQGQQNNARPVVPNNGAPTQPQQAPQNNVRPVVPNNGAPNNSAPNNGTPNERHFNQQPGNNGQPQRNFPQQQPNQVPRPQQAPQNNVRQPQPQPQQRTFQPPPRPAGPPPAPHPAPADNNHK